MEETTPQASPAADQLRVEMRQIAGDKSHPLHEGYWGRDEAGSRLIDEKYAKVHGNAKAPISDGTIATVETPLTGRREPESESATGAASAALSPEDTAPWVGALESLHRDWGADFEPRMATVRAGIESLDRRLGKDMSDDLIGAFLEAGGDPVIVYKIGEALGRPAGRR